MPKYTPAIDLDAPGITEAVLSGAMKLQPGQWVRCGPGNPSRFSHATSTTIYAAHPGGGFGSGKIPNGQFQCLRDLAKRQAAQAA